MMRGEKEADEEMRTSLIKVDLVPEDIVQDGHHEVPEGLFALHMTIGNCKRSTVLHVFCCIVETLTSCPLKTPLSLRLI